MRETLKIIVLSGGKQYRAQQNQIANETLDMPLNDINFIWLRVRERLTSENPFRERSWTL